MNIDDGRVLAIGGGMLADGEFEFEGAEAHQFARPSEWMIEVRDGPGRHGTQFGLRANPRRDADGLWSADWPIHSVAFQSPLPPLDQLLDFPSFALSSEGVPSDRVRFDLAGQHTSFAWVVIDYVAASANDREMLRGVARVVSIDAVRTPEAIEFRIEAHVADPKRGEEPAPPFTVRVTARLSFATMALAGSDLWWRGGPERWALPASEQTGPLADVLTLDRAGGAPYFAGTLDLGPAQLDFTRGGWVHAFLSDRRLRLRSQPDFQNSRGFVSGSNFGPELVFHNLGPMAWKELLADGDEAVLDQSGAGIGHVEGVTGRDVGERGPHEQPITSVQIRLSRREEGLRVAFDGKLGEMRQTPSQPPLGPEFHGDFLVPTAFLFARRIDLRNQWAERQKRLGKG